MELVASFANRLNLLKYGEKIHANAASLPLERTSKKGSDHAHFLVITDSVDLARHRSSSQKPVNSLANYRRSACR
jgi:hypothetical protein